MCWCVGVSWLIMCATMSRQYICASMQHVHVRLYLLCVLLGRQPLKLTTLNLCVYYIMYCTVLCISFLYVCLYLCFLAASL